MDILNTLSALRVLFDCLIREKPNFAQIPHTPSKTVLLSRDKDPFVKKGSARRCGIDGEALARFVREVSEDPQSHIHSLVVLSDGKCVFEAAKEGYGTDMPHATYSMCKTLTGLAIGMLIDDGLISLDDSLLSFFPEHRGKLFSLKHKSIKVSHLLTMTSRVLFNEVGVIASESYTRSFFESLTVGAPGSSFFYNSMNSYILAEIVCRVTKSSLSDFLKVRLFEPLGIRNYFWERSQEGIEKGGWGLYLSPRSMAKIGQMMLSRGVYDGKRIVSEAWIVQMTKRKVEVPDEIGVFDYGYHVWTHESSNTFLLNGMLGQNVLVIPKTKTVVVMTGESDTLFQDIPTLHRALKYLSTATPHDTRRAKKERRLVARHFAEGTSFIPPYISKENREAENVLLPLCADRFTLPQNNAGILPLMTRLIQNSPSPGIRALRIEKGEKKDTLRLIFTEGKVAYSITAGNARFLANTLSVHGEFFSTCAAYTFGTDEMRRPYFKLEIRFPALANTRRIILRKQGDGLSATFLEQPSVLFIEKLLASTSALGLDLPPAIAAVKLPVDKVIARVGKAFSPCISLRADGEDKNSAKPR